MPKPVLLFILFALLITGCLSPAGEPLPPASVPPSLTATQTSPSPTSTATPVPSPTETIQPASTPEPYGCQRPPEDYTRVEVNGATLNQRTLSMLAHAQEFYGGVLELTGDAITQGSYSNSVSASFGTHMGGGAVDLSVLSPGTYTVLWDSIDPLLHALRAAGFAAWLREYGELYPDSPIHIHAIAIGDRELSAAAQEQLTGVAGYFRGYSGLPVPENGIPAPDRYGAPILCQWMIDLGYQDLR